MYSPKALVVAIGLNGPRRCHWGEISCPFGTEYQKNDGYIMMMDVSWRAESPGQFSPMAKPWV